MNRGCGVPPGMRDERKRRLINPLIRDEIFFEKYGAETDYEFTRLRVRVAPGGGTPLHFHRSYTERFLLHEGFLTIVVGDHTRVLTAGQQALVPLCATHQFRNDSRDTYAVFQVELRPAHEGFERSLYLLYGLAQEGECSPLGIPKSIVLTCLIAQMSDMAVPGAWMGLERSIVSALAAYARWSGQEKVLLDKYWH